MTEPEIVQPLHAQANAESDKPEPPNSMLGRRVAILIGINEYQNGIPRLRNAVRDVESVAQVLRDGHGYQVELLLNEQASLAGLRSLIAALPTDRRLDADTRLVVYFAGHGIAEETDTDATGPQGFLLPQDAQRDDLASFLPMTEVQELLHKLPCRHLLLLLDCCFAGAFRFSQTRSLATKPATLYRERYDRYLRDPARQVITSAAADERALDAVAGGKLGRRGTDPGNSPFAEALCKGLRGEADVRVRGQPEDGVIVANELHAYLEDHFMRLEQREQRSMQKPLLWSLAGGDKGQFIFLVPGRSIVLPSALTLNEQNNPYRGLEPYEEKNADLFFGREEVVEQLCRQVKEQPLTVVCGASGSGKSSVVRAGLICGLGKAPDWCILPPVRPGNHPMAALLALSSKLGAAEQPELGAAVAAWRTQNPGKKLLLVIDQLEELVTMGAAPEEQQRFLESLRNALLPGGDQVHVVMTLRSDFEPHFGELLAPKPGSSVRFQVRPMTRQELRLVIERPASERVLYFEPVELVDKLIDEVKDMPGALPLLSFTMSELYRAYVRSGRSDRCLTLEDYQKLNGVAGALSQRADEIFKSLDPAHRDTLRRVILRMVALEAGEVARRRVPMDELRYGQDDPEQARIEAVIGRLREARLVVSGKDNERAPYVEPAHDKLVLGWPQLWSFIKQEQEIIPLHRLVTQEAAAWVQKNHNNDNLWSANPRLPLVVELQNKERERWNALEAEFIRKSERHRLRKRNLVRAAVGSIIVILSGLTAAAYYEARLANKRMQDAVVAASRIVAITKHKLGPVAGAASAQRELLTLGSKLLTDLGRGAEDNAGAREIQTDALIQQADLLLDNGGTAQLAQAQALYESAMQTAQARIRKTPKDPFAKEALARVYGRQGKLLLKAGKLPAATARIEQSQAIITKLMAEDPTNSQWQRDQSVCESMLGDVLTAAGNLDAAAIRYKKSLDLMKKCAATEPSNSDFQNNLSASYNAMGTVLLRVGNVREATACFEQALAVIKKLAESDPTNFLWQNSLSASYDALGNVLMAAQHPTEAKGAYKLSLAILQKLAEAAPTNSDLQDGLSVSYGKLGDVLREEKKLSEATDQFERSIALLNTLAKTDPANTSWQSNLSASYRKLGDVLMLAGNLPEAKERYEKALTISQKLAASDPTNSDFQSLLSGSYDALGTMLMHSGKLSEALKLYEQALALSQKSGGANPANAVLQHDQSVYYDRLGGVLSQAGNLSAATARYEQALAINQKLAADDPKNQDWQRGLAVCYQRLGDVLERAGKLQEAKTRYEQAVALGEKLVAAAPKDARWKRDLAVYCQRLGEVLRMSNNLPEAKTRYEQAVALGEQLVTADPKNTGLQNDLVAYYQMLGNVLRQSGKLAAANARYEQARAISEKRAP